MYKKSIFLLMMLSQIASAHDFSNPIQILPEKKWFLDLKTGFEKVDREFEQRTVVVDTQEDQYFPVSLDFSYGWTKDFSISFGAENRYEGKLEKQYLQRSTNLQDQTIRYHGFHALHLFLIHRIPTKREGFELAGSVRGKGSIRIGREDTARYGANDLALGFHYTYFWNKFTIFGLIDSEAYGKRRLIRSDGETETRDSYTRFRKKVGLQSNPSGSFYAGIAGSIELLTDYTIRSPSYNRVTDKGFGVSGDFYVGKTWSEKWNTSLSWRMSSEHFNIVTDDRASESEFENESSSIELKVTWVL